MTPRTVDEACAALAANPGAVALAGGTDLMVEVNAGRRHLADVVSLSAVAELRGWSVVDDRIVIGAMTTYTDLLDPQLAALVPALAQAARTVGSPQIRNAGTVGGNVGTASPAGDLLPVLAALDAQVELAGVDQRRTVPVDEYVTGPKRTTRRDDELIASVSFALTDGPQEFLKVGTRSAMVISVVSLAAITDLRSRSVRLALGSAAPTPVRARPAEALLNAHCGWDAMAAGRPAGVSAAVVDEAAELVGDAASPIDDHRSTARYRRHAVQVLARRAILRMWPSADGTAP
jgi:CO/xanthine dehydrogenase FAD-binding subunit